MERAKTNAQVTEYCHLWRKLNVEYEEYAKSVGMTYSSLLALSIIYDHPDDCMQKTICEESFLPKQTVNQIITSLFKQGLVRLEELESDRRYKSIHLTDRGLDYANTMLPKIKLAENKAMESLSEDQRQALLRTTSLFFSQFHNFMSEKLP